MYSETIAIASATFSLIETITVLRTRFGVVLQWRNRLARRTYKQYLPSKRCGGCEFEPHREHCTFISISQAVVIAVSIY